MNTKRIKKKKKNENNRVFYLKANVYSVKLKINFLHEKCVVGIPIRHKPLKHRCSFIVFVFSRACCVYFFCMLCLVLCFPVLFMVGTLKSPEIDACYHFTRALLSCERGTVKSEMYVYAH